MSISAGHWMPASASTKTGLAIDREDAREVARVHQQAAAAELLAAHRLAPAAEGEREPTRRGPAHDRLQLVE